MADIFADLSPGDTLIRKQGKHPELIALPSDLTVGNVMKMEGDPRAKISAQGDDDLQFVPQARGRHSLGTLSALFKNFDTHSFLFAKRRDFDELPLQGAQAQYTVAASPNQETQGR